MTAASGTPFRPTATAHSRRRRVSGLLLALLGVLSLAGVAAGGAAAGSTALNATASAATGDPALLRNPSRIHGLQTAQPFCKGDDGDDTVEPLPTVAALYPPTGPYTATTVPYPAPAASVLRPLRDRPQSPRAPPHLT